MPKISAGLLMYRFRKNKSNNADKKPNEVSKTNLEVFLGHPGGPFWKNKDSGAWSIIKGEVKNNEDFLETAKREFKEETGIDLQNKNIHFIYLKKVKQKSGKIVHCWAFEDKQGLWPGFFIKQHFIKIEYPYKSKKIIEIPEINKAEFFEIEKAKEKINPAQKEFLEKLEEELSR